MQRISVFSRSVHAWCNALGETQRVIMGKRTAHRVRSVAYGTIDVYERKQEVQA